MDETTVDGWDVAARAAAQEVAAWRRAHPRATLTEIELAVEGAVSRLQGRLVADLAHGAGAEEPQERPVCPQCGAPMVRRGRQKREVLLARRAEPLRLERTYWRCSSCGTGLFPPR